MAFTSILGQEKAVRFLQSSLRSERLAHAYLFHGPPGVGKFKTALEFAKALLCPNRPPGGEEACDQCASCRQVDALTNPSLRVALPGPMEFEPERERELLDRIARDPYRIEQLLPHPVIPIRRIRDLQQFAHLSVAPGQRKVILLPLADRMNPESANAFLKLLEEPPERVVLILTTADPGALPQTVLSRCQKLRFSSIPDDVLLAALQEKHGLEPPRARVVAGLAAGSYGQGLTWIEEDMAEFREQAVELLRKSLKGLREEVGYARALTQGGGDPQQVRNRALELLDVLQLWVRDALLLTELGEEGLDLVVNRDHQESLFGFSYGLSHIDFEGIFEAIDDAAFQIQRNVTVSLALAGLMVRLHRSIRR